LISVPFDIGNDAYPSAQFAVGPHDSERNTQSLIVARRGHSWPIRTVESAV